MDSTSLLEPRRRVLPLHLADTIIDRSSTHVALVAGSLWYSIGAINKAFRVWNAQEGHLEHAVTR